MVTAGGDKATLTAFLVRVNIKNLRFLTAFGCSQNSSTKGSVVSVILVT
jgi:hypothetical protein